MEKPDVFMPLYIGDYLAGTSRLTTELHGAYMLLIMDYWMNGPLPDDDSVLASISKMQPDAWSNARASLKHYFRIEDGCWKHKRVEQELGKAYDKKRQAKEKAERAAAARWKGKGKGKQKDSEDEERQGSPKGSSSSAPSTPSSNAPGNAPSTPQAMHEECPSPSPSPSQVSSSKREGAKAPDPPPPEKTKRFKKPTRDDVLEYMIEQGMDLDPARAQSQKFIDHYTANGWKVGKNPMKSWQAAVRSQWLKPKFDRGKGSSANATRDRPLLDDLTDRSWAGIPDENSD